MISSLLQTNNNKFLRDTIDLFQEFRIVFEVRTVGALQKIQQQSFDQQSKQLAIAEHEEQTGGDNNAEQRDTIHLSHLPTKYEIRALFHLWNHGIASNDARRVTNRYASNASLFTTDYDTPLFGLHSIKQYYEETLGRNNSNNTTVEYRIIEGNITIDTENGLWAQDNGIYEQSTIKGETVKRQFRYTFFYIKENNGKWKIVNHHTSEVAGSHSKITTTTTTIQPIPTPSLTKRSSTNFLLSPRHKRPNRRQSQVEQLVAILSRRQSITEEGWRKLDLDLKQ
jgi:uncharacterized protein (TIGR02246 family)